MSRADAGATPGLTLFVTLSFLGTWLVAATLRVFDLNAEPAPLGTRLFTMCLLYAVTMGWQPLVATWMVRRWVDPGGHVDLALRPSPSRGFGVVAVAAALGLATAAAALEWTASRAALPSVLHGGAERELFPGSPAPGQMVTVLLTFLGTIALVWVQAFTEEIGWRGYFLPRAMAAFGRWRGLVLHGIVWGLWYAPVLFFSSFGRLTSPGAAARSLGFVVTCVLVGVLFGWLRLASRSVVPVVIANTTLTLAAGLPYVIHDTDAGVRSAIFRPVGWLVLGLAIAALLLSRWRGAVKLPEPPAPRPGGWLRVLVRAEASREEGRGPRDRRTLH